MNLISEKAAKAVVEKQKTFEARLEKMKEEKKKEEEDDWFFEETQAASTTHSTASLPSKASLGSIPGLGPTTSKGSPDDFKMVLQIENSIKKMTDYNMD